MRPEGPAFNRPGRKAGIEFIYVMSAEGAALQMHRKYCLFASGFVPHLRCSFLLPLPFPTLRSGLFHAGPSGLMCEYIYSKLDLFINPFNQI